MTQEVALKPKDFESDQEIRWCPGCGDYSILAQMKKVLPTLGLAPEQIVFVSGIGCSSRFPYYLNTYGVHSIHGRAPAVATGLKLARPELSVWVITGDGDGLSIGGNHLIHALRRNLDINILLFNNQIYGLTKGQFSPTSPQGQVTRSTPYGSLDAPLNPLTLALGAEASFVARSVDVWPRHLAETLKRASAHRGTSFVEIYQNCNIYNDLAFEWATDRKVKDNHVLELEHGAPMVFGAEQEQGIVLDGLLPKVVKLGNGISQSDLLVHDENRDDPTLAYTLSRMRYPQFPEPFGVLRSVQRPIYEESVQEQIKVAQSSAKAPADLHGLFNSGDTWQID
jgi:2-oxoglutarate ferredoxin oxidoreductase subunit beta